MLPNRLVVFYLAFLTIIFKPPNVPDQHDNGWLVHWITFLDLVPLQGTGRVLSDGGGLELELSGLPREPPSKGVSWEAAEGRC